MWRWRKVEKQLYLKMPVMDSSLKLSKDFYLDLRDSCPGAVRKQEKGKLLFFAQKLTNYSEKMGSGKNAFFQGRMRIKKPSLVGLLVRHEKPISFHDTYVRVYKGKNSASQKGFYAFLIYSSSSI